MINSVDIIIFIFVLFFFASGWRKGIVRVSLKFIAMFLGAAFSLYHFSATQNILQSIAILIFGSIGLAVALSILLKIWNKKISHSKTPAALSRVLGSILGLSWGLWIALIVIFSILILPLNTPLAQEIKTNIFQSFTYMNIANRIPLFQKFIKQRTQNDSTSLIDNLPINISEKQIKVFRASKEFQNISQNESLQEIVNDAALKEKIENRDITALVNDPKIQKLLQDKDFTQNIMGLYSTILKENSEDLFEK
ncbi:MAG: hypothetical protein PHY73_00945 [Candidatus Omnitrophica bacterium]|nr:hypothetical protein [Candidatus Omnitrophota bacterium]